METSVKKAMITNYCRGILLEVLKESEKKVQKLLDSGAIDIEDWDPDRPMILPKTIIIAVLQSEAEQYEATGTSFRKDQIKNVKYFKLFI